MVEARTCYDHLAGRLGMGLYGALVDADALVRPARSAATWGAAGPRLGCSRVWGSTRRR
jgi:hypothetical protein